MVTSEIVRVTRLIVICFVAYYAMQASGN